MPSLDRMAADYSAEVDTRARKDRQRVNIQDYRYVIDTTWDAALARALLDAVALNRDVYLPGLIGGYKFIDRLTLAHKGVRLVGDGRELSQIRVYSDFNMASDSIVRILTTATDTGAGLIGIGIVCDQPATNVRASMIKYPWPLRFTSVARCRFRDVRITGAWDGVDASGNTGGLDLGVMEIGALNRGILIDGAADFVIGHLKFWLWGFSDATRKQVYQDGNTVGLSCGRCDGFGVSIETFGARIRFYKNVDNIGALGVMPHIKLDGARSRVEGNVQFLTVGGFYKSSDLANDYVFSLDGGNWNFIGGIFFGHTSGTAPLILNNGANLMLGPMSILEGSPDAPVVRQNSGKIDIVGMRFLFGAHTNRTAPFIDIQGGDANINIPQLPEKGTGSGLGIRITNNGRHNVNVGKCDWGIQLPASISNGCYTFESTFTAVPTVQFTTNGDFVPAYNASGSWTRYQIIANRIHVTMRLEAVFTHSTASGPLRILPNVPYLPVEAEALAIGALNNVVFGASPGLMSADIDITGVVSLRKTASGAARTMMGAVAGGGGEFPSNAAAKAVFISGNYKA